MERTATEKTLTVKPKKLPLPVKLAVGAVAGAFGTSCIFPIDMIKTRLQSSKGLYSGPLDCFRQILRNEGGPIGFYKGLGVNLIGVIPEKAMKLSTNELFRERLEREDGSIALHHEILAGAGAGFCQVVATNPMELIKIRMQMQATLPIEQRQSSLAVIRSIGFRGMYTGTAATLSRDVPFSILFFPGYANMRLLFADKNGENSTLSTLAAGSTSGAIAAGAVTPADLIKTRLQVAGGKDKYGTMLNAFKIILRDEGFAALFKGVVPRMVVVGPLFGITLLAFEAQKSYMIKHNML